MSSRNNQSVSGQETSESCAPSAQDLSQGTDRFAPSLIGRRADTNHGERGTIVGAAFDPARCTFRPDFDGPGPVDTFTPRIVNLTLHSTHDQLVARIDGVEIPDDCPLDDAPMSCEANYTRETSPIPDVLYAVSTRVERRDASGYSWMVDLPTFYLDSRVQGIVSEDHAARIVVNMLAPLGHDKSNIYVQACATLAPILDRSGS